MNVLICIVDGIANKAVVDCSTLPIICCSLKKKVRVCAGETLAVDPTTAPLFINGYARDLLPIN